MVQAPVEGAQAVDWIPGREELAVVSSGGVLAVADPVMGTRTLCDDLDDPAAVAVSPDSQRLAVLERGGALVVKRMSDGADLFRHKARFLVDLTLIWHAEGLVAAGEGLDGRQIWVLNHGGQVKARGSLPPGVAVGADADGKLVLGKVTERGAHVVGFQDKLPRGQSTKHRLRFSDSGMLFGVAEGGVAVWNKGKRNPTTVRCYGVSCAALDITGQWLAIGTRDGGVAVTAVAAGVVDRSHPDPKGGHDRPVLDVAFSSKGKWLASASQRCWIWSWEAS